MLIQYKFADGEVSEIEVSEKMGSLLIDCDRQEYNNDHAETRRHISLSGMDYEGMVFAAADDVQAEVESAANLRALHNALDSLSAEQRALLQAVYFERRRITEIARENGVTEGTIRYRLRCILQTIKNII